MIWNFTDASSVDISGLNWYGTVLAPSAADRTLRRAAARTGAAWEPGAGADQRDDTGSAGRRPGDQRALLVRARATRRQLRSDRQHPQPGRRPGRRDRRQRAAQADPLHPNRVVRILSVSGPGSCTQKRPVTCQLGTMALGQEHALRAGVRPLVLGSLTSVVRVTSCTPEVNTTNNVASAGIVVAATLKVAVAAPTRALVGALMRYQVRAHVGSRAPASFVRICQRPPQGLLVTSAPGTFRYRGSICRDLESIEHSGSAGFTVYAVPGAATAGHTLSLPAQASAPGIVTAHGYESVAVAGEGFTGNG
jgi:hypothetical protein